MLLVETYVAESIDKGLGLFSKNLIPKGTIIWQFVDGFDIKVHVDKYESLTDIQKDFVDTYFWKEGEYLYSSCDRSIFQNHSFNANSIPYEEDKMVASRDIHPGEEILVNYGAFDDYFENYKDDLK